MVEETGNWWKPNRPQTPITEYHLVWEKVAPYQNGYRTEATSTRDTKGTEMKPDNANVFNPGNRSNTPTKELPKNGRSSVGSTIKTIVLFPVTFVMALIFAKRLGS